MSLWVREKVKTKKEDKVPEPSKPKCKDLEHNYLFTEYTKTMGIGMMAMGKIIVISCCTKCGDIFDKTILV